VAHLRALGGVEPRHALDDQLRRRGARGAAQQQRHDRRQAGGNVRRVTSTDI
jgi:hypothetical protein